MAKIYALRFCLSWEYFKLAFSVALCDFPVNSVVKNFKPRRTQGSESCKQANSDQAQVFSCDNLKCAPHNSLSKKSLLFVIEPTTLWTAYSHEFKGAFNLTLV